MEPKKSLDNPATYCTRVDLWSLFIMSAADILFTLHRCFPIPGNYFLTLSLGQNKQYFSLKLDHHPNNSAPLLSSVPIWHLLNDCPPFLVLSLFLSRFSNFPWSGPNRKAVHSDNVSTHLVVTAHSMRWVLGERLYDRTWSCPHPT